LEKIVKPYVVLNKGGVKVGVFGLGCDTKGLIADKNFKPAQYNHPYAIAQQVTDELRAKGCDVVVCLSHLGTYGKAPEDPCDVKTVNATRGIDVVIGGHTHRLYDHLRVPNIDGDSVPVCQMAKSGTYLGKIMLSLCDKSEK
jgi:5'-nucleotidase